MIFLSLAAMLIWRYFRYGGGWAMLKAMNEPMEKHDDERHYVHHAHA
jgi:hypothetical protein